MKKRGKIRILFQLLFDVIIVLVLALLLYVIFASALLIRQLGNSQAQLHFAIERVQSAEQEMHENYELIDSFSEQKGALLSLYMERNDLQSIRANIGELTTQYGIDEYYLYDANEALLLRSGSLGVDDLTGLPQLIRENESVMSENTLYYMADSANATLVYGIDTSETEAILDDAVNLTDLMSNIKVGSQGYILVVDTEDNTVLYAEDDDYIGRDLKELTDVDTSDAMMSDLGNYIVLDGEEYYGLWGVEEEYQYGFLAIVPRSELELSTQFTTVIVLAIFAAIVILMNCYGFFLRNEEETDENYRHLFGKRYLDKTKLYRITNVVLVGLIVLIGATFYMETLTPLSRRGTLGEERISSVASILDESDAAVESLQTLYNMEYTELAQGIACQLEHDADLSQQHLQMLEGCADLYSITVLDGEGNTVGSSSSNAYTRLSTEESDSTYEFWDILNGFRNIILQDPMTDDAGNPVQWAACRREDTEGLIQIGFRPELLMQRMRAANINSILNGIEVEDGGFLFAISADENHTILAWPTSDAIGSVASDYGLDDNLHVQNYAGYQTISDVKYLISGIRYGTDQYLYAAFPLKEIYMTRTVVTVAVAISAMILLGILSVGKVICKKKSEAELEAERLAREAAKAEEDAAEEAAAAEEAINQSAAYYTSRTSSGKKRRIESVDSRYHLREIRWRDWDADAKAAFVTKILMLLLYLGILFYLVLFRNAIQDDPVISYIVNCKWEKGINVFSMTYILGYMTTVVMGAWIVQVVLTYVMSRFGARMETMSRLLANFIKYAAIIGGGFHCLSAIGVNTSTLVTTSSVVVFVGGLGAKDIVADVIAGIFIVFEGTFRVGDIVTIGDWRGTVVEIGIRTTKVVRGGNIKVINNSSISNVINMTKEFSSAYLNVYIDYHESIERIEAIMEKELPLMKERIPEIERGPYYSGILSLDDKGMKIGFMVKVQERTRWKAETALKREMMLLFERYHINVPYPQMMIRYSDGNNIDVSIADSEITHEEQDVQDTLDAPDAQ